MQVDTQDESMGSGETEPRDVSARRGRWFQLSLGGIGGAIDPAFSVWDRLRHIHEAPLNNLRRSLWWMRKTFFTKRRSQTPAFLVDMSKPEIIQFFGNLHFDPGWEMSYNYHGEVLNVRRIEYRDHDRYNWWQVHIRGYRHDEGGIELTAHYETAPTEHPDAHVELFGLDVERGMTIVEEILEDGGVAYEMLQPEPTE